MPRNRGKANAPTGVNPFPAPVGPEIMLRICKKPECFDLNGEFLYFECFNLEIYAYIAASINIPNVLVHLQVIKWSHNVLKNFYFDWMEFKHIMKSNGVTQMVITKEGRLEDNKSWVKFLSKFGLCEPKQVMIATYDL